MSIYLTHHRAFCEHLAHLHDIGVSWDEKGSMPLRKKALQTAMEFFGQRPDLAIGAEVQLVRGGLEAGLFRGGRDLRIQICSAGTFLISGHRPRRRPDFMISKKVVCRELLREVHDAVSSDLDFPTLDQALPDDVTFSEPFDGFTVMRLIPGQGPGECRLMIGRRSVVPDLYAYHDAIELPDDLYRDQPLSGNASLRDLLDGYMRERRKEAIPA